MWGGKQGKELLQGAPLSAPPRRPSRTTRPPPRNCRHLAEMGRGWVEGRRAPLGGYGSRLRLPARGCRRSSPANSPGGSEQRRPSERGLPPPARNPGCPRIPSPVAPLLRAIAVTKKSPRQVLFPGWVGEQRRPVHPFAGKLRLRDPRRSAPLCPGDRSGLCPGGFQSREFLHLAELRLIRLKRPLVASPACPSA